MCLATGYVSFSECGECIQNCDGGVNVCVWMDGGVDGLKNEHGWRKGDRSEMWRDIDIDIESIGCTRAARTSI